MSQPGPNTEVVTILRHLEDVEERLAKLYRLFSEKFAEDAEAAFVFYRMSVEEKSHAALVQFQSRLAKQNPKLFPAVPFDLDATLTDKVKLNKILDRYGVLDLESAVTTALELETAYFESHCRAATSASVPELSRLLASLGAGDETHIRQLIDFAGRRGIAAGGKRRRP